MEIFRINANCKLKEENNDDSECVKELQFFKIWRFVFGFPIKGN